MNTVKDLPSTQCTGCGACMNICPAGAISLQEDNEGFLYPVINECMCISCNKCVNTCPANHFDFNNTDQPECYAVCADDITRFQSSSGGVFGLSAYYILENGGAVCGVRFADDFRSVYHTVIYDITELWRLLKSKYVQSDTRIVYTEIKQFLEEKCKPVLFCGCPCQVAGLLAFLEKPYKNLYTIDLVCHAVPSPKAYKLYIDERSDSRTVIDVDFRCNHRGWGTDLEITFENDVIDYADWKGIYYRAFLEGFDDRNACYTCKYARLPRVGDITLGDFWGIRQIPELKQKYDDNKGTSMVLVNNDKGKELYNQISIDMVVNDNMPLKLAVKTSWNLHNPIIKHKMRKCFFHHLDKDGFHGAYRYASKNVTDVGIVGWWYSKNYGSVLTYYSLYTFLQEQLGLSVKAITYPGNKKYLPNETATLLFAQKYFTYTDNVDRNNMYELNNYFDSFIIGSDQLWRYKNGFHNYFMLDFVHSSKRKIAIATSFGHDYCDFPSDVLVQVKKNAQRLDAISVREQTGVKLAKEYFGVDAECILDPVFLSDTKVYSELAEQAIYKTDGDFIFAYMLDPNVNKVSVLKYLCDKLKIKITSVTDAQFNPAGRRHELRECAVFEATVEELLWHFQHAKFILTDSFHGTCFSILFNKPFISIPNVARGNARFNELLTKFDLLNRKLDKPNEIEMYPQLLGEIDYTRTNNILEEERERSIAWIKKALDYKF